MAEQEAEVQKEFEIELTDDVIAEVEKSVLDSNFGKAKHELTAEIEAAKNDRIAKMQEDAKPLFDKVKELMQLPENKDKSVSELQELAQSQLGETEEEVVIEPLLPEEFKGFDLGFGKTEEAPASGKTATIPDDVKAELEEYRALKEDKALQAFLSAKKLGKAKDFNEMYKRSGLHIDANSIPAENLYRHHLSDMQRLDPTITKEEIDDKIRDFSSLDKFEKAEKVAPLRARLEAEQGEAMKAFLGNVAEITSATSVDIASEVSSVSEELKGKYLGKTVYGVKVDEKAVNEIVSNYRKGGVRVTGADGKVDVARTAQVNFLVNKFNEVLDSAFKAGAKESLRKETVKRSKPSLGLRIKGASPSLRTDAKKELEEAVKQVYRKN